MIVKKTSHSHPYELSFSYSYDIIQQLKAIPYKERQWDANNKKWRLTKTGIQAADEMFKMEWQCPKPISIEFDSKDALKWFVPPFKPLTVHRELISERRPDSYGLWWAVGVAKSAGAVCEFLRRKEENRANRLMVIVCIAGLRFNWQEDLRKLFGIEIDIIDGEVKNRAKQIEEAEAMICVTPFTTLRDEESVDAIINNFDSLVVDESHILVNDKKTNIKREHYTDKEGKKRKRMVSRNPTAYGGLSKLAKNIKNRLVLTGTPNPNKPTNSFTSLHIIDPDKYPSKYTFEQYYCIYGGYLGKQIIGYRKLNELKEAMQFYGMFASKKDYCDIPPKTEITRYVDMSANTKKAINSVVEIVKNSYTSQEELQLKDAYIKVHQAFVCPTKIGMNHKSDKLKALKEIIESTNEKIIVFASLKGVLDEIASEIKCARIDGDMTDKSVRAALERFKGEEQVLIATVQKMGAGYNLQHAKHIVIYDTVLTGAQYEQGIGRAWRTGQTNEVQVYNLVTRNPFEMNRMEIIQEQREQASTMENDGDFQPRMMLRMLKHIVK